jgi:hypothetical protein
MNQWTPPGSETYSEDEVLALARQAYRAGHAAFDVVAHRSSLLVI